MDILNIGYDFHRYPATQQSFPAIRRGKQLYVDKTAYVYELTRQSASYFLSRPRRFGKSMLLSTITAYFEGRRELFEGLAIEKLETEWTVHPVINISMGSFNGLTVESLQSIIDTDIEANGRKFDIVPEGNDLSGKFKSLILQAHEKTGREVVVLIDEYDKPLNETRFTDERMHETMRSMLRGFYSVLKDSAEHLRFVMITGVTKYTQVSIFSGLNNLLDLSLEPWCNAICGISESEMRQYFVEDMATFGRINNMTPEEVAAKFKYYYDGYRFASFGENIYNPYSVVNAFARMRFEEYWFVTGTPYHLIKTLLYQDFDFEHIEGYLASESELMGIPTKETNPIGLLYQTGYLTIKDYEAGNYVLGFPNKEVKTGFYEGLLSILVPSTPFEGYSASNVRKAAHNGNPQRLVALLDEGLCAYNCLQFKGMKDLKTEALFNSMLYGLCSAIGLNVKAEYTVANGIIDLLLQTKRYTYIIECKKDSSAAAAMQQLNQRDYASRFKYDTRKLFKIGINYNTSTRQIDDVLIEE